MHIKHLKVDVHCNLKQKWYPLDLEKYSFGLGPKSVYFQQLSIFICISFMAYQLFESFLSGSVQLPYRAQHLSSNSPGKSKLWQICPPQSDVTASSAKIGIYSQHHVVAETGKLLSAHPGLIPPLFPIKPVE